MISDSHDLAPCPFCMGKTMLAQTMTFADRKRGYIIDCQECGIKTVAFGKSEAEVIRQYNCRPSGVCSECGEKMENMV